MKLLVIDPGHGGKDPGAVSNNLKEKNLNLLLAQLVADKLSAYDLKIILTREADTTLGLAERVKIANRSGADFFLSLHVNAGAGEGFESFIHTSCSAQSQASAYQSCLHRQIMAGLAKHKIRDRGKKRANFYVLRKTKMPALLLENLFLDHPREAKLWQTKGFPPLLANSIVCGLVEALEISEEGKNASRDHKIQDVFYTVQIGAFRHRQNAEKKLQKAKRRGFHDAFIQAVERSP
ncbi:MAG: N-acetylmuramoyl-L-alanine amidase [Firmicutes bacterium]|jgi:N-acetylmuramoyl-L-alanine amidase|nr:N-acetylmuramoyl-L-alanine amidase [Bacillota bacterium]